MITTSFTILGQEKEQNTPRCPSLTGFQQGEYRRMNSQTESGCFGYSYQKIKAKITIVQWFDM